MSSEQHAEFEQLVDLAERRLAAHERATLQAHLVSCVGCAGDLAWIERTVATMAATTLEEPPVELVSRATRLLGQFGTAPEPTVSVFARVLAALRFDSAQAPLQSAFGLRAGEPGAVRQLLFDAAEREIQITLQPQRNNWSVAGQVLGACTGGGKVELRGPEFWHTTLSELCEFQLDGVAPGRYALVVGLDDVEVEVSELVIG